VRPCASEACDSRTSLCSQHAASCISCGDEGPYCPLCHTCVACDQTTPGQTECPNCSPVSSVPLVGEELSTVTGTKCAECDDWYYCKACVAPCSCGLIEEEHYVCASQTFHGCKIEGCTNFTCNRSCVPSPFRHLACTMDRVCAEHRPMIVKRLKTIAESLETK
jgi:hypothetical protein